MLKRLGLRCAKEGCRPGDPRWHEHTTLEGRLPGGELHTQAAAARYPAALCTSILRGVAAQHAREGSPMPRALRKRLDEGRAVYNLEQEGARGDAPTGPPGGGRVVAVHGCRNPLGMVLWATETMILWMTSYRTNLGPTSVTSQVRSFIRA